MVCFWDLNLNPQYSRRGSPRCQRMPRTNAWSDQMSNECREQTNAWSDQHVSSPPSRHHGISQRDPSRTVERYFPLRSEKGYVPIHSQGRTEVTEELSRVYTESLQCIAFSVERWLPHSSQSRVDMSSTGGAPYVDDSLDAPPRLCASKVNLGHAIASSFVLLHFFTAQARVHCRTVHKLHPSLSSSSCVSTAYWKSGVSTSTKSIELTLCTV